jgi:type II secretory pathway component PulK
MTPLEHRRKSCRLATRRGGAALFVLICLSFATVAATLLMQTGVAERTYASRLVLTRQAEWLVEAGLDRAAPRLARSSRYAGETWPISAAGLGPGRSAVVHIEIKQDTTDPTRRSIRVQAKLREGDATTVQAAKDLIVSVAAH